MSLVVTLSCFSSVALHPCPRDLLIPMHLTIGVILTKTRTGSLFGSSRGVIQSPGWNLLHCTINHPSCFHGILCKKHHSQSSENTGMEFQCLLSPFRRSSKHLEGFLRKQFTASNWKCFCKATVSDYRFMFA